MAFRGALLLYVCIFVFVKDVHSFVDLVCRGQHFGELDHQSMLSCIIKPRKGTTDVNIDIVVWKKLNADITPEKTVLFFNDNTPVNSDPSYIFAEPSWNKKNMNVSLLITSTKLEDEGDYVCEVMTDSGISKAKTTLNVTAKYNEPVVNLTEEKDIPNADKALVCTAQGGYPAGKIRWFDGDKYEWTKSAKLEVKKMDDGLVELSSKLPLLPKSTFPKYICVVYNSSGGKEHERVFNLNKMEAKIGGDNPTDSSISQIVAPAVVIGSLIVGLLFALLIYKRRSNQVRRPSSTPFLDPRHHHPTEESDYVDP